MWNENFFFLIFCTTWHVAKIVFQNHCTLICTWDLYYFYFTPQYEHGTGSTFTSLPNMNLGLCCTLTSLPNMHLGLCCTFTLHPNMHLGLCCTFTSLPNMHLGLCSTVILLPICTWGCVALLLYTPICTWDCVALLYYSQYEPGTQYPPETVLHFYFTPQYALIRVVLVLLLHFPICFDRSFYFTPHYAPGRCTFISLPTMHLGLCCTFTSLPTMHLGMCCTFISLPTMHLGLCCTFARWWFGTLAAARCDTPWEILRHFSWSMIKLSELDEG